MCGRKFHRTPPAEMARLFRLDQMPNFDPNYNLAPTQSAPVLRRRAEDGRRSADLLTWGLVPSWSKEPKPFGATFNARADTMRTLNTYRGAWKAGRRCLVMVDGFYEWQKLPNPENLKKQPKQPWAISRTDGAVMAMAGLWESKRLDGDAVLRTYTVITTDANDDMAGIHDRMPVILEADAWAAWLGEEPAAEEEIFALTAPGRAGTLRKWPVAAAVGNVRNNYAGLLDPVEGVLG